MTVSTSGALDGLIGAAFFRAAFFIPARLTLALTFFGIRLATIRFADFPRRGVEAVRVVLRVADLRFRNVADFLRLAMIAPVLDAPERIQYPLYLK